VRILILAVTLVVLAACASSGGSAAYDPNAVTLCIENTTVGYGNVVAYASTVRFTVYPGEQVCRQVRPTGGGLPIRASTSGGGMTGPLRFSFTLPGSSACWHWRVSSARGLDVVSCDEGPGY
jgi:hypothetical protein